MYDKFAPLYEYKKEARINFARSSISRAKMDLIRLAKFDPDIQNLVRTLQAVQITFRLRYAKKKEIK